MTLPEPHHAAAVDPSSASAPDPSSAPDTIARLARRFLLPDPAGAQLATMVGLLAGAPGAPTAIRDRRRILDEHIADALVALELPCVGCASELVDIGSGPGIPGVPLAIALPGTSVTLLESNARKCSFIDQVVRSVGLRNAQVVRARAEAWPEGIGRFDVVTARAVAGLDVVAEYAAPLLRLGGVLVAWRGKRDPLAEQRAARAASVLGLEIAPPIQAHPFEAAANRHLHPIVKISPTPSDFPRRPGLAAKRPLGASG